MLEPQQTSALESIRRRSRLKRCILIGSAAKLSKPLLARFSPHFHSRFLPPPQKYRSRSEQVLRHQLFITSCAAGD